MRRVTLADAARDYLVRHHGDDGLSWNLDAGMDCLYDIYDEWMAANGIAPEHRARSGRSCCERARAVPRAVMRALKHTRRGQMLFDTSRYTTGLRTEKSNSTNRKDTLACFLHMRKGDQELTWSPCFGRCYFVAPQPEHTCSSQAALTSTCSSHASLTSTCSS